MTWTKIEDIKESLRLSDNGKAPGLDRIPYELYKLLDILYRQSRKTKSETFNIRAFLTKLYADIERYGIIQGSNSTPDGSALCSKKETSL
jgi:hypothetical protein